MSSQDDVDAVRARTDILQVVAPYVALKRSGRTWKGLCPFHNEKTPSFQVNPDIGRWHCFGQCSEGGDVFKFIQKIDNLTFPEALERLALQSGVVLTRVPANGGSVPVGEKDRLYAALNAASSFYQEWLARDQAAKEYLVARGVAAVTVRDFSLGFAGGDWDTLPRALDRMGIRREDAVRAGILVESERGGQYDKLRGRIVFPIVDVQDRVVAFGGRLMHADPDRPKYLNSAETPLFSKSRTLYGLAKARKAIADLGEAIVVEGYLDVISCHQAGFTNVVATLGTALTEEHALVIGRLARRVLLAFDGDSAGIKAAQRSNAIFEAQEIEVRMLALPKGEDPDSLINRGRSVEFEQAIAHSVPVNEYRIRQILSRIGINASEDERVHMFQRELLPVLRSTKSVTERERYVRICARVHPLYPTGAAMAEDQIRQDVDGRRTGAPPVRSYFSGASRISGGEGTYRSAYRELRKPVGPRQTGISVSNGLEKAEDIVLQALLEPDLGYVDLIASRVKPEMFVRPAMGKLARFLIDRPGAAGVQAALDDPELSQDPAIAGLLLGSREILPEVTEKQIEECLNTLDRHRIKIPLEELRERSRMGDVQAIRLYTKFLREQKGPRPDHVAGAS